ncbi:tetratricopeptide repeat protein [Mucilaginibacter sp. KACC 22063]|uniref:tetratricopeptide repeat protein n=1 Tax=Mucilaginibacter sp. KACC 22063 TaxID=3025666 RepID=UPI00236522AF|nr:tetratricopeptide repeat protein [Mucilaginibacter sp. KACC 22063]WDF55932.1 tetratricopeptide repeat protein [Mucilaginibacter sp. KACC 22063]
MKLKLTLAGMALLPALVYAQTNTEANVMSAPKARALSSTDSLMVRQLYFSAMREKTIENFSQATEILTRVLQIDPNNAAAMYELAGLKRIANDNATAQQLLETATTIQPDNVWYWVALAGIYEKSNNLPRLDSVFSQLIRLQPDNPDYYFDKANGLVIEKKYDEALAVYDSVERITGVTDDLIARRQRVYLAQGKIDKVTSALKQAIVENPNNIKYYLMLGEVYNSNGLNEDALNAFNKAAKLDPQNGGIHLMLADIYRNIKNYEASFNELKIAFAIPDLQFDQKVRIIMGYLPKFPDPNAKASALELSRLLVATHPTEARGYAIYGDMLLQNQKFKEAKAQYQKSIALNDKIYAVHEQLVRIDMGESDFDGAIKDGENALTLFPNQAWMNYLVGVAYAQKKNFTKALGYLQNAASLETQDKELLSQCYSGIGDCYHDMKDFKASDDAYDKSLSYNPDNAYTLNNYAYYLSVRGVNLDKAEQMSKRSNELQPATASFEDTYAWILFKQKKYAEAKVWMEKALVNDKDHSAVQTEHYGDIMFYLGNVEAAVQNWKKSKSYGNQSSVLERKINEKKYIE